jgi:glycosyltransferase involved in cell wall biosynthesis
MKHYPKTNGRIRVIWLGQNISEQSQCSANDNIADGKPYLLSFGHWPHKNVEASLHILRSIRMSGHDVRLKVIGVGHYIDKVISPLAISLGISKYIDLLGEVADEKLADLYKGATALVFLSKYEGFGLPVIEAMAAGCPAIVSDQSSLPEIAGKVGPIVKTDDYPSASKYILRLLENPSWAQSERKKVLEYASAFTWDKTVKETVEVYYKVLKAHKMK